MSIFSFSRRSLFFFLLCILAGSAAYWYYQQPTATYSDLVYGNGRLEATEVDVATKIAGRLSSIEVQEGDDLQVKQKIAEIEATELQAQLRAAEAQVQQALENTQEVIAGVASAESQYNLARITLARSDKLMSKNFISKDQLDQDRSALQVAQAGLTAARTRVKAANAAVATAKANAEVLQSTLQDTTLTAPIAGRVLYRLAEPGEVLAAGGKVVTLLDLNDVTMSVYLSAAEAGQVTLGAPAHIMLDALADPVPAKVVYVAPRAQFTPKEVETRNEREKLMFRIKVRVDPAWLATHATLAKPGMPGVAYIKLSADTDWPAQLPVR
ncbi:secretion protein HlyD family protein [Tolumonas auensis DSM 9187]|uniref:Secretion protein HlyD family protein n=1 Tax=Tolumonas auensis (strain DSM 9187 / NBRC 110442 / TA 4) TaxID=595494 RepID=C4LAL9_TOLAT|nr:HlyD family efflux transporter periplasmic adaptor subunit [Tolumonas auensis]ACQ92223.1 secretion protein HlyD family protein [Tolumonas auensis DSM 9187]